MELTTLLGKKEDLHPDLQACLETASWGQNIRHPLIYALLHSPEMNALVNRQYEMKKQMLARAEEKKDWEQFVFLHERPYRFEAFSKLLYRVKLTNRTYWSLLGSIWIDSENLWQVPNLRDLLLADRPGRQHIMSTDDRALLKQLPEEVTVYRGHGPKNRRGWSWTLSHGKADWFSRRYRKADEVSVVTRAEVPKQSILALLLGRGEMEVVLDPKTVFPYTVLPLGTETSLLQVAWDAGSGEFLRRMKTMKSIHGPAHWQQVERTAVQLANLTTGADVLVCRLFAYLHDCCRDNDGTDIDHGMRAARFACDLLRSSLSVEQLDLLNMAIANHVTGKTHSNPTIGCCWDADRLDLPRVGIVPHVKYLSTDAAKSLIWKV